MFHPVDLINPVTGRRHTARTAVDLNDRLAEGYVRAYPKVEVASITPVSNTVTVAPWNYSVESEDSDDTDTDD